MTTLVLKDFLHARHVAYQQVRFSRNRVNVQRPKPVNYEKEKFLRLARPIPPPDLMPLIDKCKKQEQVPAVRKLSPLDHIYAAELRQMFRDSKVSAIFSRNPMSVEDFHMVRVMFFKANMKLVVRKRSIVKEAFNGTEFMNLIPLFEVLNMMAFSDDQDIAPLFQVCKKEHRISLLAAVVDNRILSVSDLRALSVFKDLQTAQSNLVQTLQTSAQDIHRGLQSHQNLLLHHLQQRAEQLKES